MSVFSFLYYLKTIYRQNTWVMKKILLFLFIFFTFVTCGPTRHTWKNIGTDGQMIEIFNAKVDSMEFVRICLKDTVSTNLDEWLEMGFYNVDYKLTRQWIYIKDTDTNRVYVLTMKPDSTYILDIRDIIIEEKITK